MAKVIINIDRYKGEYELDSDVPLTGLNWSWIKKVSGYLPQTVEAGFEGDDPELYAALAVIALHRAGKIQASQAVLVARYILEAPVDGASLVIDFTDEDAEKATLSDEDRAEVEDPEAETP